MYGILFFPSHEQNLPAPNPLGKPIKMDQNQDAKSSSGVHPSQCDVLWLGRAVGTFV